VTLPSINDGGDDTMPFGQYAGTPYVVLVVDDPQYVRWLLSQSWLDATVAAKLRAAVADWRDECAAAEIEEDNA
jgi:hypothetical protein